MKPADKKMINAAIKQLLTMIDKKTMYGYYRTTSRSEAFVEVDPAAGLPLNKLGLHIQLSNWGQWVVYLSIGFERTETSYEGLAFCSIEKLASTDKLGRWLISKATVKSIYEEMNLLFDSYISNQWLDGNPPTPLTMPTDSKKVFYEVWYRALYGWDPLYFCGRTDSLMKELRKVIREGKKHRYDPSIKNVGYYFTYLFHPEDIAYRTDYIRRHDEALLNSVNNFTEPVLQAMQDVCYEICGRGLSEFDPDKEVNVWEDERFEAELKIEKVYLPADEENDSPSTYYRVSIMLRVPDGIYAFDRGSADTAEEMRQWLSHYTHNPWIVNCLSKDSYEHCVRDACLGIPDVYLADEVE